MVSCHYCFFQSKSFPFTLWEILELSLTILGKSLIFYNKRPNLALAEIVALLKQ